MVARYRVGCCDGIVQLMPVIDLAGLDTQLAPMAAIYEVLTDYGNGFTSGVETLNIISAVVTEWRQ